MKQKKAPAQLNLLKNREEVKMERQAIEEMRKVARESFRTGSESSIVMGDKKTVVERGRSLEVDPFQSFRESPDKPYLHFHTHVSGKGSVPTVLDLISLYEHNRQPKFYAIAGCVDSTIVIWKRKEGAEPPCEYRNEREYFKNAYYKFKTIVLAEGEDLDLTNEIQKGEENKAGVGNEGISL